MQPWCHSPLFWVCLIALVTQSHALPQLPTSDISHGSVYPLEGLHFNTTSDPRASIASDSLQARQENPERRVWVVLDVAPVATVYSIDAERNRLIHAYLIVGGSFLDGAMTIDLIPKTPTDYSHWVLRMQYMRPGEGMDKPWMSKKSDVLPPGTTSRHVGPIPEKTRLTNAQILDPEQGVGLVTDIWKKNPWVNLGTKAQPPPYSGPLTLVKSLLEDPSFFSADWVMGDALSQLLSEGIRYWTWQTDHVVRTQTETLYTVQSTLEDLHIVNQFKLNPIGERPKFILAFSLNS